MIKTALSVTTGSFVQHYNFRIATIVDSVKYSLGKVVLSLQQTTEMLTVYILQNKKTRNTQIGFTDDLAKTQKHLEKKFLVKFTLITQEKYKSKKDAMIRVKQLRNKMR